MNSLSLPWRAYLAIILLGLGILWATPLDAKDYTEKDLEKAEAAANEALNRGDYPEALAKFKAAAAISESIHGPEAAETAQYQIAVGQMYYGLEEYDQAIACYEKFLPVLLKQLGEEHSDVAITYLCLGEAYAFKGEYDRAISHFEKALAIQLIVLGAEHPDVAYAYNGLGQAYEEKGDYDRAISYYEKAIKIYLQGSGTEQEDLMAAYFRLGEAYRFKGEYDRSITYYEKALSIGSKVLGGDEHPDVAFSYYSLGCIYALKGEMDRGIAYYEKALAIQLKTLGEEHPDVAETYHKLGEAYYEKGEYIRGIPYYEQALAIRLKISGPEYPDLAAAYNELGEAYQDKGEYERGITCYEKALALQMKTLGPEHPDVAATYNKLAMVHRLNGAYDQGIAYCEQALAIQLKTLEEGDPSVAETYGLLGFIYLLQGEYDRGISYFEKALAIQLKARNPEYVDVAMNYNMLGLAYRLKGQPDRGIAYYEKALTIQRNGLGEDHLSMAVTYSALGDAYQSQGDVDRAIDYYEKALAIRLKRRGEGHPDVALNYVSLGRAYLVKKDLDQAIANFEKSLEIRSKALGPDDPWVELIYLGLGMVYQANTGKYSEDKFQDFSKKFLAVFKKMGLRQYLVENAAAVGLMFMENQDYEGARTVFEEGFEAIEKARLEAGVGKTELTGRNYDIYRYGLKNCLLMNDRAGAFRIAEMSRERGFLDQLSLGVALSSEGIDPEARGKCLELVRVIEATAQELRKEIAKLPSEQDPRRIIRLSNLREAKEREFATLEAGFLKNERYRNLRRPSLATLAEAQALCTKDSAILEYVIWEGQDQERQSYCLVITAKGLNAVELAKDFEYGKAVDEFRKAIHLGDTETIVPRSGALHQNLITPLNDYLKGINHLMIVPDGPLALLPFDALSDPASGKYLGETYLISMHPSVSVMRMTERRVINADRSFLGFGGASYTKSPGASKDGAGSAGNRVKTETNDYYQNLKLILFDLPGSLEEVKAITDQVSGKEVRIITGQDVTEAKVKELSASGELNRYRIIHFACHGLYNGAQPSLSAVIFSEVSGKVDSSEDGYLTVDEAAMLNLRADILNLSACETGKGQMEQGEGVIGLTRAFQVAGANRVGVTLWMADDRATRDFMVAVYEKVNAQRMAYLEAYTATKREYMHSEMYGAPYFWSGFVLYGL